MQCFVLYKNDIPAAVAAVMDNNGIASLEFVATIREMRRQGLSRVVCERAIEDAFINGARILTVRAVDAVARGLYESLGFSCYNHAL
jgi:ribosomal protein S18 acetylase RimI-like enzyme